METPPPYNPPQKRKSNALVWWIVGIACLCCVVPGLLLGGASIWGLNKFKGLGGCTLAYNDLSKAIQAYEADHDGKLPHANNWQDEVRSYYRKAMTSANDRGPLSEMSPEGDWGCMDSEGGMSGMAFNTDVSGKKLVDIKDPESTTMVFETEHPSKNQHQKYSPQPFLSSPLMIGKIHRGWMELPVAGPPVMVGQYGNKVPIRTGTSANGFGISVNTKSGSDNQ